MNNPCGSLERSGLYMVPTLAIEEASIGWGAMLAELAPGMLSHISGLLGTHSIMTHTIPPGISSQRSHFWVTSEALLPLVVCIGATMLNSAVMLSSAEMAGSAKMPSDATTWSSIVTVSGTMTWNSVMIVSCARTPASAGIVTCAVPATVAVSKLVRPSEMGVGAVPSSLACPRSGLVSW